MIRKRIRYSVTSKQFGSPKMWKNKLVGIPCFLLGNGPSLTDHPVKEYLGEYFTIGINKAFEVIDPTILLWQDVEFYHSEKHMFPKLQCLKYCRDIADLSRKFFHFRLLMDPPALPLHPAQLSGRGTSGILAFELAWVLGCDPIVLLGMDCCYRDGKTDFYGMNHFHKDHTLRNCKIGLRWIKEVEHGRTIIDCSQNTVFDKHYTLLEAISLIGETNLNKMRGRKNFTETILHVIESTY